MRYPSSSAIDVRFTDVCYEIPSPSASLSSKLTSCFSTSTSSPPPSINILQNISGSVPPGTSLAILGPSGSGKTSLLNLLAARSQHPPTSGNILFNGHPRVARTKRHIGYVMQDDVFFSKLTVRETLQFTADIRLPSSISPQEKSNRVDDVLRRLRLQKCQNIRIGDQQFDKGISGGERKRVNIANELLHDPALLLADECTSGLDSSSAYTVISLLKELCEEGRTIIATIHQPSSQMFSLFDNILLLAAGRVAYFGPPSEVVSYFGAIDFPFPKASYNPADYMLELVIDDEVEDGDDPESSTQARIISAWQLYSSDLMTGKMSKLEQKENCEVIIHINGDSSSSIVSSTSPNSSRIEVAAPTVPPSGRGARIMRAAKKRIMDFTGRHDQLGEPDKYPCSWYTQVAVLSHRAFKQKRGIIFEPFSVLQYVLITMISAIVWFRIDANEASIEDRLAVLSFTPIFWAFTSVQSALHAFPVEQKVVNKERAGGSYRLSAYFFAKTTAESPSELLFPFIYSALVYYTVNLNPYIPSFILFAVILTLNVFSSQGVGLFVSSILMNVKQAQVITTSWLLISMLVSGYYINPDNIPSFVKPLRTVSFIKYSYEALVQNEMLNDRTLECSAQLSSVYSNFGEQCPINAESLLSGAQINGSISLGGNISFLVLWSIAFRVMAYFCLKLLHTTHKPSNSSWKR